MGDFFLKESYILESPEYRAPVIMNIKTERVRDELKYNTEIFINKISVSKGKGGMKYYTLPQLRTITIALFEGKHRNSSKAILAKFLLKDENLKIIEHHNKLLLNKNM